MNATCGGPSRVHRALSCIGMTPILSVTCVLLAGFAGAALRAQDAAAPNAVPNGGFEEGTAQWSWEQWKGRSEPGHLDRTDVFEGNACYRLTQPGHPGERFINSHTFPVTPFADYMFSVSLACDGLPPEATTVQILQWGSEKGGKSAPQGWICTPPGSGRSKLMVSGGKHPWRTFELQIPGESFKPSTDRLSVYIRHAAAGVGVLGIDAVKLTKTRERPDLARDAEDKGADPANTEQAPAVTQQAGNLWPGDTSFETGTAGWLHGVRSDSPAAHGSHSLLVPSDVQQARGPNIYQRILKNQPYSLSFAARSDSPSLPVLVDVWHLRYSIMKRVRIHPAPTWQRFTMPIPAQDVDRSFYVVFSKEQTGSLQIDALQFERGDPTPYRPTEALSVAVDHTGVAGNILFSADTPLSLPVRLFNDRHPSTRFQVRARTTDHSGTVIDEITENLAVPHGQTRETRVRALPRRDCGYYVTQVSLSDAGGTALATASVPCGVVRPPRVAGADPESFFGMHGGVSTEAMSRIGVKWLRNFRGWRWLEREAGVITLTADDYTRARQQGMQLMETVRFTLQPTWLDRNDPTATPMDDFCRFLGIIVSRAGKDVTFWEIENEPDLTMPSYTGLSTPEAARVYADLVGQAAETIRAANPEAKVMASGVSGGDCRGSMPFSRTVFGEVAPLIDVFPIHPYANARHIGPDGTSIGPEANGMRTVLLNALELVNEHGGDKPIWIGELGWALDVRTDPLGPDAMRHAAFTARALILARSVPEVQRVMWFKAAGCVERKVYEYGLWRSEYEPLPAAVAYAVAARQLHRARPVEPLFESDLQAYAFATDGPPVVAVWRHRGDISSMLVAVEPETISAVDMLGRPLDLAVRDGRVTVPVSEEPCYITGDRMDLEALCNAIRSAEVDLDPVTLAVLFGDASTLSGYVKNTLPIPLKGTLSLGSSGHSAQAASRTLQLEAGEVASFSFDIAALQKDTEASKEVTLTCATDQGTVRKTLSLSLQPCIEHTVRLGDEPNLDDVNQLHWVTLDSRDDILPPDPGIGWDGPDDLSVRATWCWNDEAFVLTAVVRDDIFHQTLTNSRAWKGDSIQLAFDALSDAREHVMAFDSNDWEYTVALTPEGPRTFRTHGPENSVLGAAVPDIHTAVSRENGETTYQIAIPWKHLAPLRPVAGRVFGFNLIVNDNDGTGRHYWMGLTPGIGEMKYPYCYRKMRLAQP